MKDKFNMVGQQLTDFSLPSSRNSTLNTQDFRGSKNLVVILLRDLHWPYCRAHVGRLAYVFDEFTALNTELIPILVDTQEHAKQMEDKYAKNKFAIYYDQENSVAKLLNQQWVWWKLGRMPGLFIVNKKGIIQFAYYSDSMADIPKNQDLLDVLKGLE